MIKICTTKNEIIDAFILRKIVFIEEQNVSYHEEFDLADKDYTVYLYYVDHTPVATARFKIVDDYAKVGRVCTLKAYRNQGIGFALMQTIINDAFKQGAKSIVLDSQLTAIPFYERCGFVAEGEIFLDANIEHKRMRYLKK